MLGSYRSIGNETLTTTSFKVQCVELTQKKKDTIFPYIEEYSRIYNIVGGLLPSLPEKYLTESNPSKLYTKWVKKGSKELLKSNILTSSMIQSAMSDAISNFKTSGVINQIKEPNIIKFVNSDYKIIKIIPSNSERVTEKRYALIIKPLNMIIPLITGKEKWGVIEHLEKGIVMQEAKKIRNKELVEKRKIKSSVDNKRENKIKAGLGVIVYNLRDHTVSIPNEILCPKIPKRTVINDIKTIVGVDLGINNVAVMCAINVSKIPKELFKDLNKNLSLKDLPGVKVLKFKYVDGFANNHKMKQLKKIESKRRYLRKEVGHRRENLKEFTNHRVSHIIADFSAQFPNPIVIFERGLANLRTKYMTWSPADVRSKSEYKLAKQGIKAFDIFPAYTSQICHRCGVIGIRENGTVHFQCPSCKLGVGSNPTNTIGQYNADGNASVNIALRGLYVLTRPPKERETVEHIDGSVAEPNTNPNENTQETIPQVISEVFDGKSVRKCVTPDTGETILGISIRQESNPMVEIHQETESQKSDFLPVINEKIILQEDQNCGLKPISEVCCHRASSG